MPGIARVGLDTAGTGEIIQGGGQNSVYVNNRLVSVIGDLVTGGETMAEGSTNVFANNKRVCRAGDKDTENDPATGSSDTFAN